MARPRLTSNLHTANAKRPNETDTLRALAHDVVYLFPEIVALLGGNPNAPQAGKYSGRFQVRWKHLHGNASITRSDSGRILINVRKQDKVLASSSCVRGSQSCST